MKHIKIIIFMLVSANAFSQVSMDSVLVKVERNNTTLSAFRKKIEADKIGNKTGIFLQNPEVEFHYLWGNPSVIGNRTDFSASQSFDFPLAYTYRNQVSKLKNEQLELEYKKQCLEILHKARMLCVELNYQDALLAEYTKRVHHARQIAKSYRKKLEAGESNALEFNKSQVYLLNLSKELETIEIERKALLSDIARLNGGMSIAFDDSLLIKHQITPDFEQWYAQAEQNNPLLQWLKQELYITHKQKQLQVAQSLPKFSAGYMSEKLVGEQFQGVSFGITIPLWENKNRINHAKAKALAVKEHQADAKLQFYNKMKALHTKAVGLKNSIRSYRNRLKKYNNRELITKALKKGEISLAEYFIELSVYYESINKLLNMEYETNKAYGELLKFM